MLLKVSAVVNQNSSRSTGNTMESEKMQQIGLVEKMKRISRKIEQCNLACMGASDRRDLTLEPLKDGSWFFMLLVPC